MLTREQRRLALAPFRDDWQMESDGDEWAVTVGHWFGIAEVLYAYGADLPAEWQFRKGMNDYDPIADFHRYGDPCPHGPCGHGDHKYCLADEHLCQCPEPDRSYVPYLDAGELGVAMLTYAGRVVDRYARRLKRAGKDY